ncbi:MAG: TetR family transcriptional regulator [Acidobacteriota bacterium]
MPRPIDKERRAEIVERVADHLVDRGHTGDSLRAVAAEVGTSARMLIHHFGTRDALIDAALRVARERQLKAARDALPPNSDVTVSLRSLWRWFEHDETRRYFRLFEELESRERIKPSISASLAVRLGEDWRPIVAELFRHDARFAQDADVLAHLVVVTLRGLARDRAANADSSGQRLAFEILVEMIAARA